LYGELDDEDADGNEGIPGHSAHDNHLLDDGSTSIDITRFIFSLASLRGLKFFIIIIVLIIATLQQRLVLVV